MGDHDELSAVQRTAKIRELNDILRTSSAGGRIHFTPGVMALPPATIYRAWKDIREFNDFTSSNDPHKERDFGQILADNGEIIFWKIDYYDVELENISLDPADFTITRRVLTIFLASEY
jgi:hypothetical protein